MEAAFTFVSAVEVRPFALFNISAKRPQGGGGGGGFCWGSGGVRAPPVVCRSKRCCFLFGEEMPVHL